MKNGICTWPGYFAPKAPIHRALAALDIGDPLTLRPRDEGGWELANAAGVAVGRMSSKFQPPSGRIVAVRVAAMLARHAKESVQSQIPPRSQTWELVLPEIEYVDDESLG